MSSKHIISLIPALGMVVIIEPNIKISNWYIKNQNKDEK